MKKTLFILVLINTFILISYVIIDARTLEPDFFDMFNGHGSIMLLIDSQTGTIEFANQSAANFYGYTKSELESMNISEISVFNNEQTDTKMKAAVDEKNKFFVFRHRVSDGDIRTVEVYSYPYQHNGRKMLFSIINDITKKTLLEEKNETMIKSFIIGLSIIILILLISSLLLLRNYKKLKEQNKKIKNFNELRKTFIDADKRLIYLKDENLKYIFVNKAVEQFYNLDASEIIGFDDFDLTEDREFAQMKRKTDQDVLNKKTHLIDIMKWRSRVYKTNKFPINLLDGHFGVGAYIQDITEEYIRRKEKEKILIRNSILVEVFSHTFKSTQEQLDYVLEKAIELTQSKFGYFYLYDEKEENFTLNSWSKDVMEDCKIINKQTKYSLEKTGLWGEVVRQRKPIIVNEFESSNSLKNGYPEGHVHLTKFMSVPVIIDNKIVAVIGLANKEDDYNNNDLHQINVLMTGAWNAKERREKEKELQKVNSKLNESKDELQLILDSTAEGVYGIDTMGKCTFCNKSGLKMLGYSSQNNLLGQNMHMQIHHSYKDGRPMPLNECKIYKAFLKGQGTHVDDEVFWRADGTSFDVAYYSYPQYKDGEIIGAVVTFVDNTERKENEEYIKYLSYHDSLTGLYNRKFFEDELKRLDNTKNLSITIIFGDVNGLKLTNDIFGHSVGDKLLKKSAEILTEVCGEEDIIARMGGDEFAILMLNTEENDVERIKIRIKTKFSKKQFGAINGSISLGHETMINSGDNMEKIIIKAEENMYKEKILNQEKIQSNIIDTIIKNLHQKSRWEESHSINVSKLCQNIGKAMDLPDKEVRKLKDMGFLHDIGKIALDDEIITKEASLTEQEKKEMQQHPVNGFRILNLFDQTIDLAEGVLDHHENWDGSGYPKGIKGEEIPKLARILNVAESYDAMTNSLLTKMSKEEALKIIKKLSGNKFDPEVVNVFIDMMQDNSKESDHII